MKPTFLKTKAQTAKAVQAYTCGAGRVQMAVWRLSWMCLKNCGRKRNNKCFLHNFQFLNFNPSLQRGKIKLYRLYQNICQKRTWWQRLQTFFTK